MKSFLRGIVATLVALYTISFTACDSYERKIDEERAVSGSRGIEDSSALQPIESNPNTDNGADSEAWADSSEYKVQPSAQPEDISKETEQ